MKPKFYAIVLLLVGLQSAYADDGDWEPGYRTCDAYVRAPIARAWRTANYVEEELAEIEREQLDSGECTDEMTALLERLDGLIGAAYDPLGHAIENIERCQGFFTEGLLKLIRDRSSDLKDRFFQASRKVTELRCD